MANFCVCFKGYLKRLKRLQSHNEPAQPAEETSSLGQRGISFVIYFHLRSAGAQNSMSTNKPEIEFMNLACMLNCGENIAKTKLLRKEQGGN